MFAFFRYRKPKCTKTPHIQRGRVRITCEADTQRTTKQSIQKKGNREKNWGKTGTKSTDKRNGIPIGNETGRECHIIVIKWFRIVYVRKYCVITKKNKQKENAR